MNCWPHTGGIGFLDACFVENMKTDKLHTWLSVARTIVLVTYCLRHAVLQDLGSQIAIASCQHLCKACPEKQHNDLVLSIEEEKEQYLDGYIISFAAMHENPKIVHTTETLRIHPLLPPLTTESVVDIH